MRQKAVEDRQRLAGVTAGTSGQWNAVGPQPIQAHGSIYSGRVWGIAVDPRNSNVVYIGTDGGGVWKTTNGGANWVPLTDSQPNINTWDLTLAPSAPDTIFAATAGGGILKSTDDGATWTTLHPTSGDYVLSVAVHPTNPSVMLAGGCSQINRSADGGNTWSITLTVNGRFCLLRQAIFDPTNGSIAYAGMEDGLHRSTDGGLTWSSVGGIGLPSGPFSYVTVAIAPSSPSVLYLSLKGSDDHLIGFYRSTNSGATWTQVGVPPNDDVTYWGWSLRVHPTNPNLIYAGSLGLSMSTDGGSTWARNEIGLHVDDHVQTYSADGNTLYIGNDGGIWSTTTPTAANTSWTNLNNTLNTAMFYPGISISPTTLNTTFGGTQDNGTLQYQGNLAWNELPVCGDGGFTAIDFTNPQVVYASCNGTYGGRVWKYNGSSWSEVISGINSQDRSDFIPPLVMDPGNSRRLYFGTYRVYQTVDGANSWNAISPDLTSSLYITTIAVAPSDPNTIYTGAPSGVVFITRNALAGTGASWTAANLPFNQSLTQITVDPQNPLTAWAAVSGTVYGSEGHVYRTTNGGATWTSLSSGLPNLTVNDLLLDPDIANTIYAATDVGVYRSVDGGQSWLPLGSGLPNVIVHSIRLDRPSRTLRAATYGRGMWDLSVPVSGQVAITIASSTPGAYFSLEDGTTHQAPVSFFWYTGAQHTVTWLSTPLSGAGTRYVFSGWTDGVSQNARTITVPSAATTYTGNVGAQYLLTVTASPAPGGVVSLNPSSTDGYYNSGTPVQISAAAASGYYFSYLSGDIYGSLPQSITMNAPHSVTVNFYCQYNYNYLPYQLGSGATSGFIQIVTGAGCSWNLVSGATWFTLTSASSGVGPATVAYSVATNPGASRSMALAITGDANYSSQPSVAQDASTTGRPTVVSMQPNSGSGTTQSFTYQFQDPNGYSQITWAWMHFETTPYAQPACDISVSPYSGGSYVYLLNDDGSWPAPVQVPGTSTPQNSQCSLDASRSSVSGSGIVLTVTVALTFKPAFFGAKLASAYAYDSTSGTSSATEMLGTWSAGSGPLQVSGLSPASGGGPSQRFTVTFWDPRGSAAISTVYVLINSTFSAPSGCFVALYPGSANSLSLVNDAATGWLGPSAAVSGTALSNSQCTVNAAVTSVVLSGNQLTLNLPLSFQTGFVGTKNVYVDVIDNAGQTSGWQTMATWTVATPPTVVSVSPASSSGSAQTFAVTLSDPQGAAAISTVYVLINSILSAPSGCYVALYPGSANSLSLVNDAATGWLGPSATGSGTALSNSQCTVNAAGASVVRSGNQLTLNLPLIFQAAFAGAKNVYVDVIDNASLNSGWQTMGTWTVTAAPAVVSVSPASGSVSAQTFAVTLSDPRGAAAISTVYVLINSTFSAPWGCFVALYPGSATSLSLVNDAANGWQGPSAAGSGTALSNSQCTVSAVGTTAVLSGNQLTLNLPLSFQAGFAGAKNVYVDVIDNAGQTSGWQTMATWTVAATLAVVSVSPASGSGSAQTFAVTLSDPRGAPAISTVYVLVNSTFSAPSGCFIALYPGSANSLSLVNDAANGWQGPSAAGSGTALTNSQCTVNAAGASVALSGNQLTLNLPLSFQAAFAGAKNVYVDFIDNAGQNSAWQTVGIWTVTAAPGVASVSPASGSGSAQTFAVTLWDPRGAAAISAVYVLINSTFSAGSGCFIALYPGSANSLSLVNDAANGWLGPSKAGLGTALSNSQCTVNAAGTSVVLSGSQLTLNLPLTFQAGFAGAKNVYVDVIDNAGPISGWQTMGTWTVH